MKHKPVLIGLAICAAGGGLFSALRAPLPWMIGPLLAMGCAKLFGAHVASPKNGRAIGQLVIGCTLGLYFTPEVAREVAAHWYLLIAAALFAVLLSYGSGWFLSRSTGLDGTTALFASVPGGAAEMTVLGERFGARSDRVVLAQSLRVMIVVVFVPILFAWLGVHGADPYSPARIEVSPIGLAALLVMGAVGGALLARAGVPNAWMLGPLAVAITLTVVEVSLSAIPVWLSNAAQLLLGCALGSSFEAASLRTAPRFIAMVGISVVLAIVASALFAWGVALAGTIPTSTMVLATAPGGMAEMCVTAKALQLGVPLVTAAHVTRVMIVVTTTGPVFRIAKRLSRALRA